MKKQWAITTIILILSAVFISNCNRAHNPAIALLPVFTPAPVYTVTPVLTPTPCAASNVSYSSLTYSINSGLSMTAGDFLITTEANYLANYWSWAPAGNPTPTPVPVDFSKQIVIGVMSAPACSYSERSVTNITTDCNVVSINITTINSYCPGMPIMNCGSQSGTIWYVVNANNLPVVGIYTTKNACPQTTTVTTGPFAPTPASSPVQVIFLMTPGIMATVTPVP